MGDFTLLTDSDDPVLDSAASQLESWSVQRVAAPDLRNAIGGAGVRALLVVTTDPTLLRASIERAHLAGIPVIVGCVDDTARRRAVELRAEEWFLLPATAGEIAARIRSAVGRGAPPVGPAITDRVERVEYEQMLHDALTGLPTLPVMVERSRALFKDRGELVVLYLNFVRYSKIEEIYGWEKLDAVLETTAAAVREFLDDSSAPGNSRLMVSFTNDDDFIFFHVPAAGVAAATDSEITDMVARLQRHVAGRIMSTTTRRFGSSG